MLRHRERLERPDVRARRIKTLEAALRKQQRHQRDAEARLALWQHPETLKRKDGAESTFAERITYLSDVASYGYGLYGDLRSGKITPEDAQRTAVAGLTACVARDARWVEHLTLRIGYECELLAESGYKPPAKPKSLRATLPLLNYPGSVSLLNPYHGTTEGPYEARGLTKAEYARIPNDFRGTSISADRTHRVRTAMIRHERCVVWLTDSKVHEQPGAAAVAAAKAKAEEAAEAAVAQKMCEAAARADRTKPPIDPKAEEFRAMAQQLKDGGPRVVVVNQLFPTPPDLARRMVDLLDVRPGNRVLEPSAGTGALLDALRGGPQREVVAVEVNPALALELTKRAGERLHIVNGDFLQPWDVLAREPFDRIIMNPPFDSASDISHIRRALRLLKPGGVLVALCANGPRQQRELKPSADHWEELPAGTFSGTNVRAALLVVRY